LSLRPPTEQKIPGSNPASERVSEIHTLQCFCQNLCNMHCYCEHEKKNIFFKKIYKLLHFIIVVGEREALRQKDEKINENKRSRVRPAREQQRQSRLPAG
jgi:hypothetical protein